MLQYLRQHKAITWIDCLVLLHVNNQWVLSTLQTLLTRLFVQVLHCPLCLNLLLKSLKEVSFSSSEGEIWFILQLFLNLVYAMILSKSLSFYLYPYPFLALNLSVWPVAWSWSVSMSNLLIVLQLFYCPFQFPYMLATFSFK